MFKIQTVLCILFILTAASLLSAAEPVQVVVSGVEGDALENMKAALALPYGLVQNGNVNKQWLERFNTQVPEKVRTALEPFGYYHSEVRTTLENPAPNIYRLVVDVQPGRQIHITDVKKIIEGPGAGEKPLKALIDVFPLKKGDVLIQKQYEEAKNALRSRAVELGYLDADFSRHIIEINTAEDTARIDLVMETGQQYRFGDIRFEGVQRYPSEFLHRYITFKTGDVFSFARLGETQLNLINSDRFKEVIMAPEKNEAQNGFVPIVVRVQESPTKRLRPGIGYATDTGPRLSVTYRDLDMLDKGHELHAQFNLSKRIQNLGAGYIIPGKRDIESFTGIQANFTREEVTTYMSEAASLETDRTRSLGKGRLGTGYVKLLRENSTVAGVETKARLVMPGLRLLERRYDNLVRPTVGHYYSVDLRGTHEVLGSDTRFIQLVAEWRLLEPLTRRLSLMTRINAGSTFQNAAFGELPASLRFFAGGDRSVRGYAYQSLGPTNATGSVIGGRNLLVGSLELDHALFTNWGIAAFFDAGNAFNSFTDIRLFKGAGMGVRYYTAVGAIRLDVARQIAVERPGYRVHITIGVEF